MHLSSPTAWSLVAAVSLASLGAVAGAAAGGVVEFDVMFPRNDTYAPGDHLPLVLAIQNATLATHLNVDITMHLYNLTELELDEKNRKLFTQAVGAWYPPLQKWENFSAHEPYFTSTQFSQKYELNGGEGRWRLVWAVYWESCAGISSTTLSPLDRWNSTSRNIDFTIERGAQPIDPVAATADGTPCPPEYGVAVNVTSPTVAVGPAPSWTGDPSCAVVASDWPTPTANPCRVRVDSAVVASMSASRLADMCAARTGHCGQSSASQPLAVAGAAGLAATFGALGFFLLWI